MPKSNPKLPLEVKETCFNMIWNEYPEKKGKHQAWIKFKNQINTADDWADIEKALKNYKSDMVQIRSNGHSGRRWQHGSTWFNHYWKDFVDYQQPEEYKPLVDRLIEEETAKNGPTD